MAQVKEMEGYSREGGQGRLSEEVIFELKPEK